MIQSPFNGWTCRGSVALGSGCGRCSRCQQEMAAAAASVKAFGAEQEQRAKAERSKAEAARERRERIATAAMQGYIATGEYEDWQIPGLAFDMADRMIAELDKNTQTRKQAACDKVLAAVRAYLPPGGLTKDELISRVIEAVDNPEFNAGLDRETKR